MSPDYQGERQILHFVGGIKRTLENVVYIYENEMTHILTAEGHEWIINKSNLLAAEVIRPDKEKNSGSKN